MLDNIEIISRILKLKSIIDDKDDVFILNNMLKKYKCELNLDFNFTEFEFKRSSYVFKNCLKNIFKEPDPWIQNDKGVFVGCNDEIYDKNEIFQEESFKIIKNFALVRLKNTKNKNELSKQNATLILNIFEEEINELITKIYK